MAIMILHIYIIISLFIIIIIILSIRTYYYEIIDFYRFANLCLIVLFHLICTYLIYEH